MGKTLATILAGVFLGTALSSCTPEGRSLGLSLLTHGAREKISHELNPNETNVNIYGQGNNKQNLPKNLVKKNGLYFPAPGYKWIDTNNKRLGVMKIPNWDEYMSNNLKIPSSFTCLNMVDTNKNGCIEKDELIGLGSYFECKKIDSTTRVICGAIWNNVKGKRSTYIFKETETGKIVKVKNFNAFLDARTGNRTYMGFTKTREDEGIKGYTIEYYIDGKKIPTRTIEFFIDYGEKGQ